MEPFRTANRGAAHVRGLVCRSVLEVRQPEPAPPVGEGRHGRGRCGVSSPNPSREAEMFKRLLQILRIKRYYRKRK